MSVRAFDGVENPARGLSNLWLLSTCADESGLSWVLQVDAAFDYLLKSAELDKPDVRWEGRCWCVAPLLRHCSALRCCCVTAANLCTWSYLARELLD